jgi:hypothetical protein
MSTASKIHAASVSSFPSPRNKTSALQVRELLLACGVLSSLVYVANNVLCALVWPQYSSFSQTISELSAIDAPSRPYWIGLCAAYNLLLLAFGIGVWTCAEGKRGLRVTAGLLIALGATVYWPPMHLRGNPATLTDTLHIAFASVTSLLILLAIGFGAGAFGKRFRVYSSATIVVLVASGVATFLYAPRVAANLPTPGMGVIERIDLGAYLLWVGILAVTLMRALRRSGSR